MPEAATQPSSVNTILSSFAAATRGGQDEAVRAWRRGYELYADYFASLAKAKGPSDLLAANADLMTGTVEAFAKTATSVPQLNGGARPTKS